MRKTFNEKEATRGEKQFVITLCGGPDDVLLNGNEQCDVKGDKFAISFNPPTQ
jgi:hypothetical protein